MKPTYLLTWKPARWDWQSFEAEIRRLRTKGALRIGWSAGANQHILKGDRVFLLRQGTDRPGIIGAGIVIKGSYRASHWDPKRADRKAIFVEVRMDSLLHPEQDRILRREDLDSGAKPLWRTQSSGVTIPAPTAAALERQWAAHLKHVRQAPIALAEEISKTEGFPEGGKQKVTVNRYERDRRNREACISIHGYKCSACRFDFAKVYGELGRNYIHVHHVVKLSARAGKSVRPDPRTDLRPVCANCHAMLHVGGNNRTIEELRSILRSVSR